MKMSSKGMLVKFLPEKKNALFYFDILKIRILEFRMKISSKGMLVKFLPKKKNTLFLF